MRVGRPFLRGCVLPLYSYTYFRPQMGASTHTSWRMSWTLSPHLHPDQTDVLKRTLPAPPHPPHRRWENNITHRDGLRGWCHGHFRKRRPAGRRRQGGAFPSTPPAAAAITRSLGSHLYQTTDLLMPTNDSATFPQEKTLAFASYVAGREESLRGDIAGQIQGAFRLTLDLISL